MWRRPNHSFSYIDTSGWLGTEYTPARAANQLWWARFPEYKADATRELTAAKRVLGLTFVRVFLHTLAFEAVGAEAHAEYIEQFLALAASAGLQVGFVLFGDGWNHGPGLPHTGNTGASLECVGTGCCPIASSGYVGTAGCSNGCWYSNPQDHQRGEPPAGFAEPGVSNETFITAVSRGP